MLDEKDYLAHHGIKGQKWGVRRYQNPDGTRTALGKKRERAERVEKTPDEKKRNVRNAVAIGSGIAVAATGAGMSKVSKHVDKNKLFAQTIKGGKDKPNISPAEKMTKEAGNISTETGKIVKTAKKIKNINDGREVKTLSDQELRKRIERLNLEKQYENLIEEDYDRGHVTADDILGTVGSVITIGGSIAAMIAVANSVRK